MSDSVRPHRRQPTRLPRPWDSPGKNTGVGGHFLLQCMKGKSESEVAQSRPTLCDPMDCSPPGSSIHGIFKARVQRRYAYKTQLQNSGFRAEQAKGWIWSRQQYLDTWNTVETILFMCLYLYVHQTKWICKSTSQVSKP